MKGPFERLKYDLRRVWECPECHHKERADGTVTALVCRCQAAKEPQDRVFMNLVEDRIQRRVPAFVPPTADEEPGIALAATELEVMAPLDEAVTPQADVKAQDTRPVQDIMPVAEAPPVEEAASDESPGES